jgi:hypothetical protein
VRILHLNEQASFTILYLNAAPGGGRESSTFPIHLGIADALPDALDAIFLTSDLQGICPIGGESVLLGVALAEHLGELADGSDLPVSERIGVILAGDLYSDPSATVRGATGDVRSVWNAFADRFAFVAGVAGNHDLFGEGTELSRFRSAPGIHLLDGDRVEFGGLAIAGVGGVIGNSIGKNRRRREKDYLRLLDQVLDLEPAVVVLHQGPDGGEPRLRGHAAIREHIRAAHPHLTVFGHCHWSKPLVEPDAGHQLLNVDGRGVLLMRS